MRLYKTILQFDAVFVLRRCQSCNKNAMLSKKRVNKRIFRKIRNSLAEFPFGIKNKNIELYIKNSFVLNFRWGFACYFFEFVYKV